ncbi:Sucrose operon repressor ScrR, LacI family [Pediococcus damnosus]|uniref:Sucrose operon repressor ScrR, LacI family n=1 Tax=Pediococcus damnosus TaxID=51663 RepID=A0A0R2HSE7_9LACO|nr:LacI family DNA-binding transcriptional regulator [Pediococcus damnosus]AMV61445.1 Sucrose operon repressor ScrR, LacI family [Pediococcus damnosus]AMV62190.1 Sucrose operon repressor ScrR, LacI family [Pediococcus damnosus]AMV65808.1 Sucrose operon repressor ScrR, LacI family [Pediococcus damnosus]AMV67949.1 Sucrose operon repressor ScrR, LacI family [Pediococcus damnosus]AMV70145.1 Sucrose operon repressor ScrR, LacI family [Pediococcus damnosus]
MTKLSDVAKKAGVSSTTVSRVINNYGSLSEKTRAKVFSAMKELNYQPNSLARSLQGKKTQLVGVIFPSVTNPFYAELIEDLENKLFGADYKIILCNSANNSEKERSYLRMLQANQVDGIIAGTHNTNIEEYKTLDLPVVSFDRHLSENIPIISSDNYQGAQLATKELIANGANQIYFVGNVNVSPNENPTDLRVQGFEDTLKQHKLESHYFSVKTDNSVAIKKMLIRDFLNNHKVDGIFASDDSTALLIINIAKELNIDIPKQLRVIGFDGTKFIQNYFPELSTISQPISDIADLLISTLELRINDKKNYHNVTLALPNKLIRSSTTASI